MSAIGRGLSAAGYAGGELFGKAALMDQQSAIDLQKAERLAEVQDMLAARADKRKALAAQEAQSARVKRVDQKTGELAGAEVAGRRGLIDAGRDESSKAAAAKAAGKVDGIDVTPADWTPAMQATVDQSLALDRKGLMDDPEMRLKASVQTGDTSEKDYAAHRSTERRIDAAEKRAEATERRNEAQAAHAAAVEQRKWTIELAKLDLQQGSLAEQSRRTDALIAKWMRDSDAKEAPKPATAERMGSIINAMNATIRHLDSDEGKPRSSWTQEQKDAWKTEKDNAIKVRARAMEQLNSRFDDSEEARPEPTPAPKPPPAPKPAASAPKARPPLDSFLKK